MNQHFGKIDIRLDNKYSAAYERYNSIYYWTHCIFCPIIPNTLEYSYNRICIYIIFISNVYDNSICICSCFLYVLSTLYNR